MTELAEQLIALVQEASPVVWAALMRQVYIDAARALVIAVVLAITAVVVVIAGFYAWKKWDDAGALFFSLALAPIPGLISLMELISAAQRYLNPAYYAIRLILGGGQ